MWVWVSGTLQPIIPDREFNIEKELLFHGELANSQKKQNTNKLNDYNIKLSMNKSMNQMIMIENSMLGKNSYKLVISVNSQMKQKHLNKSNDYNNKSPRLQESHQWSHDRHVVPHMITSGHMSTR